MTRPVYQGIGTYYESQNSISPSWPTHLADDIGILLVATANQTPATPSGWTLIDSVAGGTSGNSSGSGLYAFWKRASSSSESPVTVADTGFVNKGVIITFRGVRTDGDPIIPGFNGAATLNLTTGNRTLTINGSETGVADSISFLAAGLNDGAGTAQTSSITANGGFPSASQITNNQHSIAAAWADSSASLQSAEFTYGTNVSTVFVVALAFGLLPALPMSSFNSSGTAIVSNPGAKIFSSTFSSAGVATVSNPGNVNRQSAFASAGQATVSNPGALKAFSAFASAGQATVSNPGNALARSSFNAAGVATATMVGAGNNASSFSSLNSSSANMVGASTVESSFSSQGSSFAAMFSPSVVSSSFSSSGSSSARMYSPTITITTLQNGSGGDPDSGAEIDWTLCDFANINLTSGTGSFPIDHINLIAGKKISVHVHNDVAATGSILWDGGDAPVTWVGMSAPPDMPANGETLHVEFECNDDRTEIFGRLFVDEEVREILDGLDRRYGRTLFDHSANAGNVSTAETTLYSDTIIGGTFAQDGDKVLAEFAAEFAMSINAKQVLLYFPTSVVIFDTGSLAITATTDCQLRATIIRKTASTARAIVTITTLPVAVGGGNAQITDEATLTGLNFDQDNVLRLTAIGGASNDVIAKLGFGEFKPAAV